MNFSICQSQFTNTSVNPTVIVHKIFHCSYFVTYIQFLESPRWPLLASHSILVTCDMCLVWFQKWGFTNQMLFPHLQIHESHTNTSRRATAKTKTNSAVLRSTCFHITQTTALKLGMHFKSLLVRCISWKATQAFIRKQKVF